MGNDWLCNLGAPCRDGFCCRASDSTITRKRGEMSVCDQQCANHQTASLSPPRQATPMSIQAVLNFSPAGPSGIHPPGSSPMTPQTASLMAEYNRWMNDRLYAAAATLEPAALTADKGGVLWFHPGHPQSHRGGRHDLAAPLCAARGGVSGAGCAVGVSRPSSLAQPLRWIWRGWAITGASWMP